MLSTSFDAVPDEDAVLEQLVTKSLLGEQQLTIWPSDPTVPDHRTPTLSAQSDPVTGAAVVAPVTRLPHGRSLPLPSKQRNASHRRNQCPRK